MACMAGADRAGSALELFRDGGGLDCGGLYPESFFLSVDFGLSDGPPLSSGEESRKLLGDSVSIGLWAAAAAAAAPAAKLAAV